jgi:hypothetical protein
MPCSHSRKTTVIILENYVDGEAILHMAEDFNEFQLMVPQAGLRIKLKKMIAEYDEVRNNKNKEY